MNKIVFLCLLALLTFPFTLFAHPHVFIDSKVEVIFNNRGLEGVNVEWEFDAMFSNLIISDYDKNGNGKFEPQEVEKIKNEAFSNLANFNYFSYLIIQNEQYRIEDVKNFSASIKNGRVLYNFFIPFELPFEQLGNNLIVGFFDESIYCDVAFRDENPYSIKTPLGISTSTEMITNSDFWSISRAPQELKIIVRRI